MKFVDGTLKKKGILAAVSGASDIPLHEDPDPEPHKHNRETAYGQYPEAAEPGEIKVVCHGGEDQGWIQECGEQVRELPGCLIGDLLTPPGDIAGSNHEECGENSEDNGDHVLICVSGLRMRYASY